MSETLTNVLTIGGILIACLILCFFEMYNNSQKMPESDEPTKQLGHDKDKE